MDNWDGNRCRVCGLKTQGDDLCNKHYEEANMTSRTQRIKDILVSLATADKLPLDLNELDPGIFEPALAGAVIPGELKDQYVSLEVPLKVTGCNLATRKGQAEAFNQLVSRKLEIRVKLDDEGVVVDAFLEGDSEPCASTWKTYQMMKDGE